MPLKVSDIENHDGTPEEAEDVTVTPKPLIGLDGDDVQEIAEELQQEINDVQQEIDNTGDLVVKFENALV